MYTYEVEKESDTSSNESEKRIKKKNNCRKCGENWTLGHKCEDTSLRYYKIVDEKQVEVQEPNEEIVVTLNEDSDSKKAFFKR